MSTLHPDSNLEIGNGANNRHRDSDPCKRRDRAALRLGGPFLERQRKRRGGWQKLADTIDVDRTTLSSWRAGGRVQDYTKLLDLAERLGVDPVALFDVKTDKYAQLVADLVEGRLAIPGRLLPVLLAKQSRAGAFESWPPVDVRGHPWIRKTVAHDPSRGTDYYARLRIEPTGRRFHEAQVWHFAFGETHPLHPWRPFGIVRRGDQAVEAFHFSGATAQIVLKDEEPFVVEMWFGLTAAEFLVSSIHGFELSLEDRETRSDLQSVQFCRAG